MKAAEEIKRLKEKLKTEKETINKLRQENSALKTKDTLHTAVIEAVNEINDVLKDDEKGKHLLWTKGFPHNVSSESAHKIQEILKKVRDLWVPANSGWYTW